MESDRKTSRQPAPAEGGEASGKMASQMDGRDLADYARLVFGLIHDFRTPLGSIVGAASTLDDYADAIDARTRGRLCTGIVGEAQRLDHLLTGLGVIARARTGTLMRDIDKVELNEFLHGMESRLRQRQSRPVNISVGAKDLTLNTDPAVLRAVIFAMLDLANEFAPEEGGVELCLSKHDSYAEFHLVSGVRDSTVATIDRLLTDTQPLGSGTAPVATSSVFLAAIQEVVHILDGQVSIHYENVEARLRQSVRLPVQSA